MGDESNKSSRGSICKKYNRGNISNKGSMGNRGNMQKAVSAPIIQAAALWER